MGEIYQTRENEKDFHSETNSYPSKTKILRITFSKKIQKINIKKDLVQ